MEPNATPEPPKKTQDAARGLYRLLAFVFGGLVLMGVAVGAALWRYSQDPEGGEILRMAWEAVKLSRAGKDAPGAKELRAAGCGDAVVMDAEELLRIAGVDGGDPLRRGSGRIEKFVICSGKALATAPSCEEVARTYVTAVGERPGYVMVQVTRVGSSQDACEGLFDGRGKPVHDVIEDDDPPPFDEDL